MRGGDGGVAPPLIPYFNHHVSMPYCSGCGRSRPSTVNGGILPSFATCSTACASSPQTSGAVQGQLQTEATGAGEAGPCRVQHSVQPWDGLRAATTAPLSLKMPHWECTACPAQLALQWAQLPNAHQALVSPPRPHRCATSAVGGMSGQRRRAAPTTPPGTKNSCCTGGPGRGGGSGRDS